jgi:hypothetical protein
MGKITSVKDKAVELIERFGSRERALMCVEEILAVMESSVYWWYVRKEIEDDKDNR